MIPSSCLQRGLVSLFCRLADVAYIDIIKTLPPILTADLSMPQAPDQGEDISFQALPGKLCSKNSYSDDQLEGKEKG